MKRIYMVLLFAVFCLLCLTGCCKHEWHEATCTEPKTCSECGESQGEPMGHSWEEATCSTPKACKICGVTEGEKLPHTPGDDWELTKTDYVHAEKIYIKKCTVCGETVDRKIVNIEKLHDGTSFIISAKEYAERLDNKLDSLSGNPYLVKTAVSDGEYMCGILNGSDSAGMLMFHKFGDSVTESSSTEKNAFNQILAAAENDSYIRILIAMLMTTDPSLDLDEAKEYGKKLIASGDISVNGITYAFAGGNKGNFIGLTVE